MFFCEFFNSSNIFIIYFIEKNTQYTNLPGLKIIFSKNKVPIFEVFSEGKNVLARIFSLIYIGDWVSYYLALLYEKDPLIIKSIQFLKDSLSKHK